MSPSLQKTLSTLPDSPGIYFFYKSDGELMYVGKATSLRSRVRSYFIGKRTSRPIEQMIEQIARIRVQETDSVLESAIAEANAIKAYLPKYNVDGKDNKSWNYIVLTKEPYPKVQTYRQHQMAQLSEAQKRAQFLYQFGPFPGLNAKATLHILRHIFLYSTCTPFAEQKKSSRACLYRQMGQCLGVCTGEITAADYRKHVIQPLVTFLKGGKKNVVKAFETRMAQAAKEHAFEEAGRLRDQLRRLQYIHDVSLINRSFFDDGETADIAGLRIEGYDISNFGSSEKVGSMVVFDAQGPVKREYRKFKIRTVDGQSDVDCLEEVLRRRLRHDEWTLPTVLLIDGGVPQVNRAKQVLKDYGIDIPIVGIAKGPERKKNEFILGEKKAAFIRFVKEHESLFIQVRDEAHRFAITFQRQRRRLSRE